MMWAAIIRLTLLLILLTAIRRGWCQKLIKELCEQQGYTLTRCKLCWINKGPFTQMGERGRQTVFWIEATSSQGDKSKGYARIFGLISGLWHRQADIKWI